MAMRIREYDHPQFEPLDISIPLSIQLLGGPISSPPINAETVDISPEGLSIVTRVKVRRKNGRVSMRGGKKLLKLISCLSLNDRVLELGIKILPRGGRIRMRGMVKWYKGDLDGDFCYLRAGICIEKIERKYREHWLEFITTVAQLQGKKWSYSKLNDIQRAERRQLERFEVSIPVRMDLLGLSGRPVSVQGRTTDVSCEGLSIETKKGEESSDLVPYLVLDKKPVELSVQLPPRGEKIKAIGRVAWYNWGSSQASYYLKAGISLEEMQTDDRNKWGEFVKSLSDPQDKDPRELEEMLRFGRVLEPLS